MMSSSDPRVPPPILPHPHQQQPPSTTAQASGAQHAHGAHGGHAGNGANGHGDAGGAGQQGQQQQPQQKPRAPKAYTEPQMAFLKSHLEEFEKRSAGPVRGDAKKYALEQAQGFVVRFGLPPEFHPLEEGETRFKEACQVLVIVSIAPLSLILTRVIQQIYNWFKNTIGRKRRQAEGKPRSVKSANSASNSKVKADRSVANSTSMPSTAASAGPSGSGSTLSPTLQWNTISTGVPQQQSQASSLAAFAGHNVAESSSSSPALATIQQPQAISLGQMHYGLHTPQQTPQHVHSNTPPVPGPSSHTTHHQQHHHQHQHQQQHHQQQPHQSTHSSTHSSHSNHHSPHEQQHISSIHPLPAPTPLRVTQGQQQQQPQPHLTHVSQETLRDAFLSPSVEVPTLASMIQIFVSSQPRSFTPLTLVVEILFGASISSGPSNSSSASYGTSTRTIPDDLGPLYANGSGGASSKPSDYGNISLKGPNAQQQQQHSLAAHSYGGSHHRESSHQNAAGGSGYSRDPTPLVQRFCDASRYWGTSIVHCNLTGVEAAGRALMGLVRRWSVWQPASSAAHPPVQSTVVVKSGLGASGGGGGGFHHAQSSSNSSSSSLGMGLGLQSSLHGGLGGMSGYGGGGKMASPGLASAHGAANGSGGSSLSEDMQRIAAERQRRKDHIQWARIHGAALEVGLVGSPTNNTTPSTNSAPVVSGAGGVGNDSTQSYGRYIAERAFSEVVARDAVWEEDEAEWVAGLFVLRGLIRSAVRANKPFGAGVERRQRDEYREMLDVYEGRWKEIKDEVRQSLATDVLFSAKEELDSMGS